MNKWFKKQSNRANRGGGFAGKLFAILLSLSLLLSSSGFSTILQAYAAEDDSVAADISIEQAETSEEDAAVEGESLSAQEATDIESVDFDDAAASDSGETAEPTSSSDQNESTSTSSSGSGDAISSNSSSIEEIEIEEETETAPKAVRKGPARAPAAGSYEITSSNITKVTFEKQVNSMNNTTWQETTTFSDGDKVRFTMNYTTQSGDVTNGKLHYTLPDNISNVDTSKTYNLIDGTNPSNTLGTYVITQDPSTGKYVVEMTLKDGFNYANGFEGTLSIEGTAENNKSSGNDEIKFSENYKVTVTQERTTGDLDVYKRDGRFYTNSHTDDGTGTGSGYATFTYYLGSYNGTNTISINDVAVPTDVDIDITQDVEITYEKATWEGNSPMPGYFGSWGPKQTITVSGANFKNGVNYTLPALNQMEGYRVTYKVPYKNATSQPKIDNTVTASSPNINSDDSSGYVTWRESYITKTVSKLSNFQLAWTITIGEEGADLSGYKLKDVMTESPVGGASYIPPKTMTVTNGGGYQNGEKITLTNGEYTFKEGATGIITLYYTTPITSISNTPTTIRNTVTLEGEGRTYTDYAEESVSGIAGSYNILKLGPDDIDGGDTSNTVSKDEDGNIELSWKSYIQLNPNATVDLSQIYYVDYVGKVQTPNPTGNGYSGSSVRQIVTKDMLLNDLVIKNSDGVVLERGEDKDYIIYMAGHGNSMIGLPSYDTVYGYYTSYWPGGDYNAYYYNNRYNLEKADSVTEDNSFQILFLKTDKIQGQNSLEISYKTRSKAPTAIGQELVYYNEAKIPPISQVDAHHAEVGKSDSVTLEKVGEISGKNASNTIPTAATYGDDSSFSSDATWTYSGSSNEVVFRVRAIYDASADKQDIVLKDVLPDGMKYKDGSGSIGLRAYRLSGVTKIYETIKTLDNSAISYDATSNTITVSVNKSDLEDSGEVATRNPYHFVELRYIAILDDDAWDNRELTDKQYRNTVSLDGSDESTTATTKFIRPKDLNTKNSITIVDYDANNEEITDTQHEKYYLVVNPNYKDLDANSDILEVEDTATIPSNVSAEFIYDEFAVYKFEDQIPDHPTEEDITSGTALSSSEYSYTYDETTHKLTVTIPDEQGVVIVYGYKYTQPGGASGTPSVTNTATIKGVDNSSTNNSTNVSVSDSSGTIVQRNFKIRKVEEGNTGNLLPGSEFELVRYETYRASDGTLDTSSTIGTKSTVKTAKSSVDKPSDQSESDTGVATVYLADVIGSTGTSQPSQVAPYTLFSLKETKAPTGYTASTDTYYFAWKDLDDTDDAAYTKLQAAYNAAKQAGWPDFPAQADITIAANTGTINVGNTPQGGPETYSLTIKKETEKPSDEEFEFSLSFSTWNGSMYNTYELDSTPQGATKDEYGRYAFKLKNGESLTIPDLPADVKYYVYEKPKTGWELISINGENADASWVENTIEDKDETVTFLNGELTTLTIKKTTENNKTGTFKFKVKLWTISYGPIWKAPAKPGSRLKAPTNTGTKVPYNLDPVPTGFTKTADGEYEVTISNGGSVSIPDLPRHVFYEISEETPTGWELVSVDGDTSKTKAEGEITGDTEVTFHNQKETTEVFGTKTWVDDGRDHVNKDEITLTLKRSVEGGTAQTVPAAEYTLTWTGNTYKFTGLPKVDDNNKEYTYTVTEAAITNYSSSQSGNDFTNTMDKGKFTIEKKVAGNAADTSKKFKFTITLKDENGNNVSGTYSGVTFNNGTATVELADGEKKEIETWVRYTYTITEDAEDYLADKTTAGKSVVKDGNETHTFTNAKIRKPASIAFRKKLDGAAATTADQFTFTMKGTSPSENSYDKTVGNDANGTISFGDIVYTQADDGKTYIYEVKENVVTGYECDTATYTVEDKITLNAAKTDITISRTVQKDGATVIDFNDWIFNNYTLMDLTGTKTWVDEGATHDNADEITLVLKRKIEGGSEETVTATPTWTGNTYTYKDLRKTDDNGNAYTYTVEETPVPTNYTKAQSGNNITNTKDKGQFTIQKKVEGNDVDLTKEFTFTITLTQADGTPVTGTYSGVDFNTSGVGTVKLKNGDSKTIETYVGVKYSITEDAGDYTSDQPNGVTNQEVNKTASPTHVFKNTRNTYGNITLQKKLAGNTLETTKEFSFKITVCKADGSVDSDFSETLQDGDGNEVVFSNGVATVKIKGDESIVIKGFPNGTKYQVEEVDLPDGYEDVAFADGSTSVSGTIAGGEAAPNAFTDKNTNVTYVATNTKNTYGDIELTKKLEGNDTESNKAFTFTITLSDVAGPLANQSFADGNGDTYTTDGDGKITVDLKGDEIAKILSIPNGAHYVIAENDYSNDGYSVNFGDADAPKTTEEGDITGGDTKASNSKVSVTATNHRDTYGDIVVEKKETGNDPGKVTSFAFTIDATDAEGNRLEGAYGDATFSAGTATVSIEAGEKFSVTGLPNGTQYRISEDDYRTDDYDEVTWTWIDTTVPEQAADNAETPEPQGIIQGGVGTNTEINFIATNNRDTYGDIMLSKFTEGNDPDVDAVPEFSFTIEAKDRDGKALEGTYGDAEFEAGKATVTIAKGGFVSIEDLPNGTTYEIVEEDYSQYGYEPVVFSIEEREENAVTDAEAKLDEESASVSGTIIGSKENGNSKIGFTATNHRDTYGDISIVKKITGNAVDADLETKVSNFRITVLGDDGNADEAFHETLQDADGEAVPFTAGVAEVQVTGQGTAVVKGFPNGTVYSIEETTSGDDHYEDVEWDVEPVYQTIVGGATKAENTMVSFTATNNKDTYGDLSLTKQVSGNDPDKITEFEFRIEAKDKDGKAIEGTFGDAKFEEGIATIKLTAEGTKTVEGLPNGTTYTLTEKDYMGDGYEQVVFVENTEEASDDDASEEETAENTEETSSEDDTSSEETDTGEEANTPATEEGVLHEVTGTIVGGIDKENNSQIAFTATNTRNTYGDLILKKELQGKDAEADKTFHFAIELDDDTISGEYGDVTFENGVAACELKGGESVSVQGLPNGVNYTVTEEDYTKDGYKTIYDDAAIGTIIGETEITTVVTNKKERPPIEKSVAVEDSELSESGTLQDRDHTLTYQIVTEIPIGSETFVVKDEMEPVLTADAQSVTVLVGGKAADQAKITAKGNTVEIDLSAYCETSPEAPVVITFKAKVVEGADLSPYVTSGIPNTAKYDMDGHVEPSNTVPVINKTPDPDTKNPPKGPTPTSTKTPSATKIKKSAATAKIDATKTDDASQTLLWLLLLVMAAGGVGLLTNRRRRRS